MSPDDAKRWLTAQKALRRELKLSLSETLLEDVVKMLAKQTEVEVFADHPALEAAKIPATLITLNLPDGQYPADKAMQFALEPRQLLAVLDDGAIRITTVPRAAKFHQTVVYDVADLLRSEDDVPTLLSTLQDSTNGQWKSRDGEGGTLIEFPGGLFAIRQSDSVHTQIALLLHELRQAKKDLPKEAVKSLPNDLETKFHKANTKDEAEALGSLGTAKVGRLRTLSQSECACSRHSRRTARSMLCCEPWSSYFHVRSDQHRYSSRRRTKNSLNTRGCNVSWKPKSKSTSRKHR